MKIIFSVIVLFVVSGCNAGETKQSWHGVDRPETWDEKDFAKLCIGGIYYYARVPNNGRAYFAVAIDKETLKPMICK